MKTKIGLILLLFVTGCYTAPDKKVTAEVVAVKPDTDELRDIRLELQKANQRLAQVEAVSQRAISDASKSSAYLTGQPTLVTNVLRMMSVPMRGIHPPAPQPLNEYAYTIPLPPGPAGAPSKSNNVVKIIMLGGPKSPMHVDPEWLLKLKNGDEFFADGESVKVMLKELHEYRAMKSFIKTNL